MLGAPAWAAGAASDAPMPAAPAVYQPPGYNASTSGSLLQDGPADNLNRFMLKITEQCYGMSDPAQRAECCKHLIENLCSGDSAK